MRKPKDQTTERVVPLDDPHPAPGAPPGIKAPIDEPLPAPPAEPAHDPVLFTVVLALLAFGVVMTYSASAVYATQKFGSPTYFFRREILWAALGLLAMGVAARTDYRLLKRWAYPLLLAAVGLLAAVLVVGARINGARRWFHVGGVSFQPAELAKLALVVYVAYSLAKKAEKVKSFTVGFVPHIIVCGVMMALVLKQPDLGTAVILGAATLLMLFVAGAKVSYLLIAFLAAAPVVYQAIVGTPWRLRRMLAFLDPWQYRHDVGYQVTESLISIGSGGVFGLGLGDGKQKLFFLPEAHTDYIMAIIGEELGLLGLGGVVILFGILVWRGARAAMRARDAFGCYLALGITLLFGLQALVNLGVVLGVLPTKGLPLPLVSYGGSTLVVDLLMVGILLNVSRAAPAAAPVEERGGLRLSLARARINRRRPGGGRRVVVMNARGAKASSSEAPA
jgi:cell division protein FtsW